MIRHEFVGPIKTDRLALRLMTLADHDDVFEWMSNPEVARYQLYEPRTPLQVADHIAKVAQATTLVADGDFIELGVVLPAMAEERDRVIGCIYFSLKRTDDLTAEIGWSFAVAHQGKGYATEAASAVLDFAFSDLALHRVYAELDPRNTSSVRLCERLGMRHEAHFVEDMMFKGAWANTGVYGILDREWAAHRRHTS
ncbi:GNAT family protein [Salinibacterium sp.]|uniref:GNAT family N-acetyltransferase n=1 Tax=Salinibacterium sp. TaxID=1915057 RepID=UPI00286CA7E5|nr:GNAT family protein [Salinibacterium sp.]